VKIAINIEHFSASKGGAEQYASELAKALADKEHDVHILACTWYEGCEKDFHCHRLPYSWFRTFRDIQFVRATQRVLLKEKYDVCISLSRSINCNIYQPRGGIHVAYLDRELNSIHNPILRIVKLLSQKISLRHFLIKGIEKSLFGRRDIIVVAISEMVKRDILSFYDFPEQNIRVIFNSIDLNKFDLSNNGKFRKEIRSRYLSDDKDCLVFLFTANNFRLKGLRNLIYAAALMKKKTKPGTSFRILVIGKGKKTTYERLAERLGCKNEFIFVGKTCYTEKFYAAADVLAQPTFYDPCSRSTLEAMAAGLPVVTSCNNGASELIENGEHGFVLDDPRDYSLLSEKLMLFTDKNLKEEMGKNARKKIEKYSLQQNNQKMIDLCEEMAPTIKTSPDG
tara:strand:- start:1579 stop:2763 length:1185 start_codon:yes stop_codon:yes gene_type:complete